MILPIFVVQCKMAPSILWCPLQAHLSRFPMKRALFREKGRLFILLIVRNEETNLKLVHIGQSICPLGTFEYDPDQYIMSCFKWKGTNFNTKLLEISATIFFSSN